MVDAWIVAGGGVLEFVGNAVRNHTVACGMRKPIIVIGIVPWGCVSNNSSLVNTEVRISQHCNVFYKFHATTC